MSRKVGNNCNEQAPYLFIHTVALREHYFRDADLGDFDTASQARTPIASSVSAEESIAQSIRVAIQSGSFSDPFPACFQQSILFCMEAETG